MFNKLVFGCLLVACIVLLVVVEPKSTMRAAPAEVDEFAEMLEKASVKGKYEMLLAQVKVEKDKDNYVDGSELGYRHRNEYSGHKNLPKGHWVYVKPYWFIWRDTTATAKARTKRSWGSEQVIGEPDCNAGGDNILGWASRSADGQDEWLVLEYGQLINPQAVLVHENYNPGALVKVTGFGPDGNEFELWTGKDPTTPDNAQGVSEVPVKTEFKINRIKIYLDSTKTPGWNEVDAVGIRDKAKKTHWATAVLASSEYAAPFKEEEVNIQSYEQRIDHLELEVHKLRKRLEELEKKLDKK